MQSFHWQTQGKANKQQNTKQHNTTTASENSQNKGETNRAPLSPS